MGIKAEFVQGARDVFVGTEKLEDPNKLSAKLEQMMQINEYEILQS